MGCFRAANLGALFWRNDVTAAQEMFAVVTAKDILKLGSHEIASLFHLHRNPAIFFLHSLSLVRWLLVFALDTFQVVASSSPSTPQLF